MARKREDAGAVNVLPVRKKPRTVGRPSAAATRRRVPPMASNGSRRQYALEADVDSDESEYDEESTMSSNGQAAAAVGGGAWAVGQEDDDGDEAEAMAAPVVFQCGTCRSIFGDSYAFVGSNADLLLVTLSAATNVAAAPETLTAKDGADAGSAFHELLCRQCQAVLGRQYVTTPVKLDAIRGLFSFATAAIASYQLGYPQLERSREAPSAADAQRATDACASTVAKLAADRDEVLKLRQDMAKVQSLLLVLDERLQHLEAGDEPDSEAETAKT